MIQSWWRISGVLGSAYLYALSFPPNARPSLAWIAIVPLLLALRTSSTRGAVTLAWLWTVAAAYGIGSWFPTAVSTYFHQPLVVGAAFFLGVSTLMAGLEYMVFAVCYRALAHRLGGPWLPFAAAAAWVGAELARAELAGGDPWALFGYSQVGNVSVVQVADVTGVYGVSFALAAANVALAELVISAGDRTKRRGALFGLAVTAVGVAVIVAYGVWRLTERTSGPTTPVAIVQGNLDLGSQWRPEHYGRNLDTYLRLTERATRTGHPRLIIWPESAMTFFLDQETSYRETIARVTGPADVELLAGGPRATERAKQPAYFNAAFLLSPAGTITAAYDKERLIPFAEYFPFGQLDLLRRRFGRVREFEAGRPSTTALLPTRAGAAGVVICNEAFFPSLVAARVRNGAEYLVSLANDSWLGASRYSAIAFDMTALRAIEQRRWLVRASTSGPSGIVDPWGRVVVRSDDSSEAVLAGVVGTGQAVTIYGRFGDVFAFACVAAVGVLLTIRRRTDAREPEGPRAPARAPRAPSSA